MRETTKSHDLRLARGDFEVYLRGKGIDIGSGDDPLSVPHVMPWDKEQGDAQYLSGVDRESFDFLYSSHCLEHLNCVRTSLENWRRVVRCGGYLYIVVPDYALYEKMQWPSVWNAEHKHSFSLSLTRRKVKRDTHWNVFIDIVPKMRELGCVPIAVELEDDGYDYNTPPHVDQTMDNALAQICMVFRCVT
jgi:SAM-dependent methyltransferase